jgi:hypothetical protein
MNYVMLCLLFLNLLLCDLVYPCSEFHKLSFVKFKAPNYKKVAFLFSFDLAFVKSYQWQHFTLKESLI